MKRSRYFWTYVPTIYDLTVVQCYRATLPFAFPEIRNIRRGVEWRMGVRTGKKLPAAAVLTLQRSAGGHRAVGNEYKKDVCRFL